MADKREGKNMKHRWIAVTACVCLLLGMLLVQRIWASDGIRKVSSGDQKLIFLRGQASSPMEGDTIEGYRHGEKVLPFLLGKGWKIDSVHLPVGRDGRTSGYVLLVK